MLSHNHVPEIGIKVRKHKNDNPSTSETESYQDLKHVFYEEMCCCGGGGLVQSTTFILMCMPELHVTINDEVVQ